MVIGSSIGSSSLLGGGVMIIAASLRFLFEGANPSFYYVGLTFVLIIYGILMLSYAKRTGCWIANEQCALIEAICSEKRRLQ